MSIFYKMKFECTKPGPPTYFASNSSLKVFFISLFKYIYFKTLIILLKLSISANNVVWRGIPVIYTVSVLASQGHAVLTYPEYEIESVRNTLHLTKLIWWRFTFKSFSWNAKYATHIFIRWKCLDLGLLHLGYAL